MDISRRRFLIASMATLAAIQLPRPPDRPGAGFDPSVSLRNGVRYIQHRLDWEEERVLGRAALLRCIRNARQILPSGKLFKITTETFDYGFGRGICWHYQPGAGGPLFFDPHASSVIARLRA